MHTLWYALLFIGMTVVREQTKFCLFLFFDFWKKLPCYLSTHTPSTAFKPEENPYILMKSKASHRTK